MNVKFNNVLTYIPSRSSLVLMCLLNTDTAVTFQMPAGGVDVLTQCLQACVGDRCQSASNDGDVIWR